MEVLHEFQPRYDAVIVGGGLHGLATAYYLAKNHGIRRVARATAPSSPSASREASAVSTVWPRSRRLEVAFRISALKAHLQLTVRRS